MMRITKVFPRREQKQPTKRIYHETPKYGCDDDGGSGKKYAAKLSVRWCHLVMIIHIYQQSAWTHPGILLHHMHSQGSNGSLQSLRLTSQSHFHPNPVIIEHNKYRSMMLLANIINTNTALPLYCSCSRFRFTLITLPMPTANLNGSCPGSLVLQNVFDKSRFFPYPVQWTVTFCPFLGNTPFPARMIVLVKPMVALETKYVNQSRITKNIRTKQG